jgi:hypothetical protein
MLCNKVSNTNNESCVEKIELKLFKIKAASQALVKRNQLNILFSI